MVTGLFSAVALVILAAAVAVFYSVTHVCPHGHYDRRFVAGHIERVTSYDIGLSGDGGDRLVSRPVWVPDHDESVWVCDEPERDRFWCRGRPTVQLGSHASR